MVAADLWDGIGDVDNFRVVNMYQCIIVYSKGLYVFVYSYMFGY